jgi:hypothetical protein
MLVEPRHDTGHAAPVLARKLIDAVEARYRAGHSYASIARAAKMTPQQLANLKADVERNPEHVITSDVMERIAGAIEYDVTFTPKAKA